MRSKYFNSIPIIFAFLLCIGVQSISKAQITVSNFTGCDITVFVGQYDITTATPCDLCPINPPTPVIILNGATEDIFGQDICGETFGWLAWTVQGVPGFGLSPNPGLILPVACVNNINGPFCNAFFPTQAFWTSSGPGPVNVVIF